MVWLRGCQLGLGWGEDMFCPLVCFGVGQRQWTWFLALWVREISFLGMFPPEMGSQKRFPRSPPLLEQKLVVSFSLSHQVVTESLWVLLLAGALASVPPQAAGEPHVG